jgi:hypothetical protein
MPSASCPTVVRVALAGVAPGTAGVDPSAAGEAALGAGDVATGGASVGTGVGSSSSSPPQAANARVARRTTTSVTGRNRPTPWDIVRIASFTLLNSPYARRIGG